MDDVVMRKVGRAALASGVLALAALGLAGCMDGFRYSDLDREATDADALPAAVGDPTSDGQEVGEVRFVDTYEGIEFYLYESSGHPRPCVLAYEAGGTWVGGCGDRVGGRMDGRSLSLTVRSDGVVPPDGMIAVGENIAVSITEL